VYFRIQSELKSVRTLEKAFALFLFAIFSELAFSPSAFATDCKKVVTYRQALACSLENHPDVLRASAAQIKAERLADQAGQIPNLELSGKA
ncbi:hypothetical protein, partial [Salmonella enterica]|uniref:hypothetical protein n=1 Tax=Salmonella enterica TaxID=28901 RepID=UPI003D2E827C